jgi:hypothetical protein
MSTSPLSCPCCGDTNTQKVSVIYEAGTQYTNSSFVAIDSNLDVATGSGKSVTHSSLALRLAPPTLPRKKSLVFTLFVFVAIVVGIAAFVGANVKTRGDTDLTFTYAGYGLLIGTIAAVAIGLISQPILNSRFCEAEQSYNSRMWKWKREYFCSRCGQTFIPSSV